MDNKLNKLNIMNPKEVPETQVESEPVEERPRWMPKVTRNKYFRQPNDVELIPEKPKTKDKLICMEKKIKKRRIKNKAARKARRKNRK